MTNLEQTLRRDPRLLPRQLLRLCLASLYPVRRFNVKRATIDAFMHACMHTYLHEQVLECTVHTKQEWIRDLGLQQRIRAGKRKKKKHQQ